MRARGVFFSMVVIALASPVFAGWPAGTSAGQAEVLFTQAVQKYQAGDYAAAIDSNERILKEQNVESSAVFFNLGNSYFKHGQQGPAILNYLRAQRLAPRDADIKANLSFARQSVEQVESGKAAPRNSRWFAAFRSLSGSEFKWLVVFMVILTGTVCLWGLYADWPRKRVTLWTGLLLAATVYILAGFTVHLFDARHRGVILTKTEARFEPSEGATVYFKVTEGMEIKVIRRKEGWSKIQRADGRSGWIPDTAAGEI